MVYDCSGLDGGSQMIKNEMLIAREIDGSGAHGESAEHKLGEMCRIEKGDPTARCAQSV
jgi:hypothetical protein